MIGKNKVLIIAEAGVNHNGSIDLAFKLIDAAVGAGADVVKFQTWKTENVVTKNLKKAQYQLSVTDDNESQFEMLKKLELPFEDFIKLKYYCDKKNIIFLSTADEIESATFLNSIQDAFKIGSSELTDLPFLKKLANFGKPVILSSGLGNLAEIETAINTLENGGLKKDKITILHCNTEYPTPYEDVNLLAMITIRDAFKINIGYSDHTLGIEVPIAAVALGATVIEKHFTLNKNLKGPDHRFSIEPDELKRMVISIRNIEKSLGDSIKKPSQSELKNILIVRKSIVAKTNIKKGEIFNESNITIKRPGNGIPPTRWAEIIGKKANKYFKKDELIKL